MRVRAGVFYHTQVWKYQSKVFDRSARWSPYSYTSYSYSEVKSKSQSEIATTIYAPNLTCGFIWPGEVLFGITHESIFVWQPSRAHTWDTKYNTLTSRWGWNSFFVFGKVWLSLRYDKAQSRAARGVSTSATECQRDRIVCNITSINDVHLRRLMVALRGQENGAGAIRQCGVALQAVALWL